MFKRYIAMVLGAIACLALGGVFVRASQTGPVATGAYRSLFAIPLLMLVGRVGDGRTASDRTAISRSDHVKLVLAGVFLAGDLCLWHISFLYTTLAEANLLANLVPFIVAPVSYFVLKEHVPSRIFLPGALAIVGLLVLVVIGANVGTPSAFGDMLALATAVFYALFLITTKGLRNRLSATRIMIYVSAYGFVVLAIIAVIRGEQLLPTNAWGWTLLVLLAISSQLGGQTLLAHAVKFLPLQLATIFILLQPVIAAGYAYLLFREALTLTKVLGSVILLVSIYWAKILLEKEDARKEHARH